MEQSHDFSQSKPERRQQIAPFTCNILNRTEDNQDEELLHQLPASYRVNHDDLHAPAVPESDLITSELNVKKLHHVIHLLWLAGRPVPPRPLHYQLVLGRDITIIERMELHLVWGQGKIFIKPLPRYLLNPHFWENHLSCDECNVQSTSTDQSPSCQHAHLKSIAFGFLLSYIALLSYESDFAIAKDKHLIPSEITWPQWRQLVREVLAGDSADRLYAHVAPRFIYGELRLNRLNLIFLAREGPLSSGFVATWKTFGSFYRDNAAWFITFTAYLVIILTAAQVGLSTTRLADNQPFQNISYGFTIVSMVVPIFALGVLIAFSAVLWTYNVIRTRRFEAERSRTLGRSWRTPGRD